MISLISKYVKTFALVVGLFIAAPVMISAAPAENFGSAFLAGNGGGAPVRRKTKRKVRRKVRRKARGHSGHNHAVVLRSVY